MMKSPLLPFVLVAMLALGGCGGAEKKAASGSADPVAAPERTSGDADVERYWERVIDNEETLDDAELADAANHSLQLLEHVDAVLQMAVNTDDVPDAYQLAMETLRASDTGKGIELRDFVLASLPADHQLSKRLREVSASIIGRLSALRPRFTPENASALDRASAPLR